jgi:hypothetical protein
MASMFKSSITHGRYMHERLKSDLSLIVCCECNKKIMLEYRSYVTSSSSPVSHRNVSSIWAAPFMA